MNDYNYQTRTGTGALEVDEGLRSYMLGVYNYMALGLAATAAIAMVFVGNMELVMAFRQGPAIWLPFIGILGLGFLGPRLIFSSGSTVVAHGVYWAYVALWGILVGPVVGAYAGVGLGGEVLKAFFITATVFGATSLFGYTTKRDLAPWGKFLFMATIGIIIAIVVNFLFFPANLLLSLGISCFTVLIFSAITAYETQMIKNLYREGAGEANKRASIFGAFSLYGSFVVLFMHILNILGIMRD